MASGDARELKTDLGDVLNICWLISKAMKLLEHHFYNITSSYRKEKVLE